MLHFLGLSGFDITLEAEQEEPTTPVSSAVATSRYIVCTTIVLLIV